MRNYLKKPPTSICCKFTFSLFLLIQCFLVTANSKQNKRPESPAEIRQIVAQAICLIEGYPDSQISKDAYAVLSAYEGALGTAFKLKNIVKLREFAKASKPATPTTIGEHNFAIAACVLFSHQKDVQALLGN